MSQERFLTSGSALAKPKLEEESLAKSKPTISNAPYEVSAETAAELRRIEKKLKAEGPGSIAPLSSEEARRHLRAMMERSL